LIALVRDGSHAVTAAMKNGSPGARKNGRFPRSGYVCCVHSERACIT
jgi:hypothetical protein